MRKLLLRTICLLVIASLVAEPSAASALAFQRAPGTSRTAVSLTVFQEQALTVHVVDVIKPLLQPITRAHIMQRVSISRVPLAGAAIGLGLTQLGMDSPWLFVIRLAGWAMAIAADIAFLRFNFKNESQMRSKPPVSWVLPIVLSILIPGAVSLVPSVFRMFVLHAPTWVRGPFIDILSGLLLMASGILLMGLADRVLLHEFRDGAAGKAPLGPSLLTTGIYRWMRHPIYFSYFLMVGGFLMSFDGLFSFAPLYVMFPVFIFVFTRYAQQEEIHLLHRFGADYVTYATRTPFFPLINHRFAVERRAGHGPHRLIPNDRIPPELQDVMQKGANPFIGLLPNEEVRIAGWTFKKILTPLDGVMDLILPPNIEYIDVVIRGKLLEPVYFAIHALRGNPPSSLQHYFGSHGMGWGLIQRRPTRGLAFPASLAQDQIRDQLSHDVYYYAQQAGAAIDALKEEFRHLPPPVYLVNSYGLGVGLLDIATRQRSRRDVAGLVSINGALGLDERFHKLQMREQPLYNWLGSTAFSHHLYGEGQRAFQDILNQQIGVIKDPPQAAFIFTRGYRGGKLLDADGLVAPEGARGMNTGLPFALSYAVNRIGHSGTVTYEVIQQLSHEIVRVMEDGQDLRRQQFILNGRAIGPASAYTPVFPLTMLGPMDTVELRAAAVKPENSFKNLWRRIAWGSAIIRKGIKQYKTARRALTTAA
jgi:protein-S-isoprenylcysteine O-methyltransferase Ste14